MSERVTIFDELLEDLLTSPFRDRIVAGLRSRSPMSGKQEWEYTVLDTGPLLSHQAISLMDLGKAGWELIAVMPAPPNSDPATTRMYFKKPKREI